MLTSIFAESRRRHCAAEKGTKLACFRPQFLPDRQKSKVLNFRLKQYQMLQKKQINSSKIKKKCYFIVLFYLFSIDLLEILKLTANEIHKVTW